MAKLRRLYSARMLLFSNDSTLSVKLTAQALAIMSVTESRSSAYRSSPRPLFLENQFPIQVVETQNYLQINQRQVGRVRLDFSLTFCKRS
jgi:hypothetical protein